MLGNGFAGSANMAESRFAAALLTIILLSKVEVAIGSNIENRQPHGQRRGVAVNPLCNGQRNNYFPLVPKTTSSIVMISARFHVIAATKLFHVLVFRHTWR